jgi:hypothetical protein
MTTTFKDTADGEWDCSITVGALRRVLADTQIDLTKLFEDEKAEAVRQLLANPLAIANVVFAVVKPQAIARGITEEAFGELLAGKQLSGAADALLDGLEVFFSGQDANMGASFMQFINGFKRGRSKVWSRALEEVGRLDPEAEVDKHFERELAKRRLALLTSGSESGASLES